MKFADILPGEALWPGVPDYQAFVDDDGGGSGPDIPKRKLAWMR
jgi:hypothetical protein